MEPTLPFEVLDICTFEVGCKWKLRGEISAEIRDSCARSRVDRNILDLCTSDALQTDAAIVTKRASAIYEFPPSRRSITKSLKLFVPASIYTPLPHLCYQFIQFHRFHLLPLTHLAFPVCSPSDLFPLTPRFT